MQMGLIFTQDHLDEDVVAKIYIMQISQQCILNFCFFQCEYWLPIGKLFTSFYNSIRTTHISTMLILILYEAYQDAF